MSSNIVRVLEETGGNVAKSTWLTGHVPNGATRTETIGPSNRVNLLAAASNAMSRSNGGMTGHTYDLVVDYCNSPTDAGPDKLTSCFSSAIEEIRIAAGTLGHADRKFVIAHELGHAVAHHANEGLGVAADDGAAVNDCGPSYIADGHFTVSKEFSSIAVAEGLANFYAAVAHNNHGSGADCEFQSHTNPDWNQSGVLDDEDVSLYSCSGEIVVDSVTVVDEFDYFGQFCDGSGAVTNRSVEYDWLRGLWDAHTRLPCGADELGGLRGGRGHPAEHLGHLGGLQRHRPLTALLLWAACDSGDSGPAAHSDSGTAHSSTHSGGPWTPAPCMLRPCVAEIGEVSLEGENDGANLGYSLAVRDGLAVVGALRFDQPFAYEHPYVSVVSFPALEQQHRWHGKIAFTLTGTSVAIGPAGDDGVHGIGVGEANGADFSGAYLLDEDAPDGGIIPQARAWVQFGQRQGGGTDVGFAKVGPDDRDWFVVAGSGAGGIDPLPGELVALPTDASGDFGLDAVPLRISGDPGFAQSFAGWDPEGDGQLDLAVTAPSGVSSFTGPWVAWRTDADRDGGWDEPAGSGASPGARIENLGDVTGDGRDDLAFSSPLWGTAPYRTGHVYLVPGGDDLRFGSVEALPIQIHGVEEGEGMGWGLAGGDVNGDGTADLIVGASGVYPGDQPGSVLVYPGPMSDGVLHAADAAAVVYGEYPYDLFGRAIGVGDADGDAQADLLIGAQGWPAGHGTGKVWLLPGNVLMP